MAEFSQAVYKKLKKNFGYNKFRPGQKEVLKFLFAGKDLLAILPTGSGKSLCYQFPAIYFSGVVIVVSPLIALMKDQVNSLQRRGIKATYINSSLNRRQRYKELNKITNNYYDIIYVAPERFQSKVFMKAIKEIKIDLFAVDEAHCISEWGHDFRPNYLELAAVRKKLGDPQILALTATATPEVKDDIIKELELEDFKLLTRGFERNNLYLKVVKVEQEVDKIKEIIKLLNQQLVPAIIYVGTRNRVEELKKLLQDRFSVVGYHGGMIARERKRAQELFMNEQREIVIATNAFGMGVDKENIRLIIHYELPGSLEAYYQEVGRAGRDGFASQCILLHHPEDSSLREFLISSDYPPPKLIKELYGQLINCKEDEVTINLEQLFSQLRFTSSRLAVEASLRLLIKEGYLKKVKVGRDEITYQILHRVAPNNLTIDYQKLQRLKQNKYNKLQEMKQYIVTSDCRHKYIQSYFGSSREFNFCPGCDNCALKEQRRAINKKSAILIQKILSCVIKLGGRFGVTTVAKVLVGSTANKLMKRGLDKLSTYGIVKNYSQSEIIKLINKLSQAGYLHQKKGKYPTVEITRAGYKILQYPYYLDWSMQLETRSTNNLVERARKRLMARLKKARGKLANKYNKPPFVVAHDKTLIEMVTKLPQTPEQMLEVSGIGQVTYEKYGIYFLQVIKSFLKEFSHLEVSESKVDLGLGDTYQQTFKLYQEGLSLEEIAAKRDLAVSTISDHLVKLIESGTRIEINRFVTPRVQEKIIKAIKKVGYEKLKPIKKIVGNEISYNQIDLVVATYKQEE